MRLLCRLVLAGIMAMASSMSLADDWLKSIPDFTLIDQLGASHSLSQYQDSKFIVFFVQGNGCPIARIAQPNIHAVKDEFESRGVTFLAINANIQDNMESIRKEVTEFGLRLPVLKDEGQVLAKALGVERTAEVFIVDPRSKDVVFRGPINDQLGYETQKVASYNYLHDALDTVLGGGIVDMDSIPDAQGCLIAFFGS